jgi:hypothetical protein
MSPTGTNVTVYGILWKSMLTFGAAAGPVRDKAELQKFFEVITEHPSAIVRRCLAVIRSDVSQPATKIEFGFPTRRGGKTADANGSWRSRRGG